MLQTLTSYSLDGLVAKRVRVEVDVHRGLPSFAIVGLPNRSVNETRERVRGALINSGYEFPLCRIVVNLASASLRSAGSGLDLAVAVGILLSSGQLSWPAAGRFAFVGELALDGSARPVPGALPIAEAARADGIEALVLPEDNGFEAALVEGVDLLPIDGLARLRGLIAGDWEPVRPASPPIETDQRGPDLADLRGQDELRRVLEIAAAGGHNLLMVGPPGAGRSLAAGRLPSILPPLSKGEALDVARVASATGRVDQRPLARPFRAPHHTIGAAGLVGGGVPARPGEVALAHRGILYVDELCEFTRDALEALRVTVHQGEAIITRGEARWRLPARFQLLAGASPCPCGLGEEDPNCSCELVALERYQARLRSALPGAIDISLTVRRPSAAEISGPPGESSADVRARVTAARQRQELRLGGDRCNSDMTQLEVDDCRLHPDAAELLEESYSGRTTQEWTLRLAQTIADLAAAPTIQAQHLAEALRLRRHDRR